MTDETDEMQLGAVPVGPTNSFAINSLAMPGSGSWGSRREVVETGDEVGDAVLQEFDVERLERAAKGGGAGKWTVGDRELSFEVEAMLTDPLSNGASGAVTTHEGSSNEREQKRPGMPFAASFARVRQIGDGIHQRAIVGLVHDAPSLV
jgi:hypothetical protein